jgi:hypothetical protein
LSISGGNGEGASRKVLDTMVNDRLLDGDVVALLKRNFGEVDQQRRAAQSMLRNQYNGLYAESA